jgi:hypothetical protein
MRAAFALVAVAACSIPEVHFTGGSGDPDATPVAPGEYVWVRSLSQMNTQTINTSAAGIVTPGYLYTTANLNGELLTSAGNADLIIASFTEADATTLYAARHGDVGSEFGLLASISTNGTPIVSGVTSGDKTVDLGKGPVTGGGTPNEDGYIGAYANGQAEWSQRIVGPGSDKILGSARGPGSTVYGAGWFEPMATFNGATLPTNGGREIFVARYNTFTGAVDLTKTYGGPGRDEVGGGGIATLAADPSTFVMSGFYDDTLAFGGTTMPITATGGGLDIWIAKFDTNGNGIWAVTYGGAGDDRDPSCVLDANGDVYITGSFTTSITFGSKTLTTAGGTDIFIAKLDGRNGSPIWAISIGSVNTDRGGRLAVDDKGHVAFGGAVGGSLPGMPPSLGGVDGYVAEYNAGDGSLIWQKVYSTAADDGSGGVVYGTMTGDLFASLSTGVPFDYGKPMIGIDQSPLTVLIRIAP